VQPRVRFGQRAQIVQQSRAVDRLALDLAILDEISQAADDLAGPQRLGVDLRERRQHVGWIVLRKREHALAGLGVRGDRRQRLVDLVRQPRGHFAHGRETGEMREAFLQLPRQVLGMPAIGDVVDGADVFRRTPVLVVDGLRDVVQVLGGPVVQRHAILDVERTTAGLHFRECIAEPVDVGRMHPLVEVFRERPGLATDLCPEDPVHLR
jgi:hypothetical protein